MDLPYRIFFFRYSTILLIRIFPSGFDFPGVSEGKESACNAGDPDSIPGSGRSPGEGNGYPFQYSCLENSTDRGTWWVFCTELDMTEQLTFFTFFFTFF